MAEWRMGLIESRFADIIWNNEPVSSTQLVKLAGEALGWKKSTTYTAVSYTHLDVYKRQEINNSNTLKS